MDSIERLTLLFERFPGIGPRQAQRFVQFLLKSSSATRRELIESVEGLNGSVHQCSECFRFHAGLGKICSICANHERSQSYLAVVASDADIAALERSGTYRGFYFVLGGTISLASDALTGLRVSQLKTIVSARIKKGLQEIILAFPANPEGDATVVRVREELDPLIKTNNLKVSSLGRGLSTGSELEYADPDTLRSALESRR